MPHRNKPLGSKQPLRVGVGVDVGNIGHIVSFLLHPKSQWKFPRQVFATATRLLHFVYRMGEEAVRTVEADRSTWHTNTRPILMLRVNRIVHRPSVVGRPGEITALKKKITRTVVSNDKNNIALDSASFGGHLPKIYTTRPSLGDFQFHGRFPLALTNIIFTDGRIRLCPCLKRIKTLHQPCPGSAVVTSTKDIQLESGCRIGTDHNFEFLAHPQAVCIAVAFDRFGASVVQNPVNLPGYGFGIRQPPVPCALFRIFLPYKILSGKIRVSFPSGNSKGSGSHSQSCHSCRFNSITTALLFPHIKSFALLFHINLSFL